jgi:hypothetical protein
VSGAGYAIVTSAGVTLVPTVSTTKRAAKVNWLVVYEGVALTNDWSDDKIEDCWKVFKGRHECVPVEVVNRDRLERLLNSTKPMAPAEAILESLINLRKELVARHLDISASEAGQITMKINSCLYRRYPK